MTYSSLRQKNILEIPNLFVTYGIDLKQEKSWGFQIVVFNSFYDRIGGLYFIIIYVC